MEWFQHYIFLVMGRGFRSATNLIPWLHAVRFVKLFLPWSKRPDSYFCSDALDWNHQTPGTHLPKRWPPVSRLRSASKECLKYMVMPQGLLAPRLTVGIFNYQFLFFSVYLILIYWHSKFVDVLLKKKLYISTFLYNFEYMLNTWWLRLSWFFGTFCVGSLEPVAAVVPGTNLLLWKHWGWPWWRCGQQATCYLMASKKTHPHFRWDVWLSKVFDCTVSHCDPKWYIQFRIAK